MKCNNKVYWVFIGLFCFINQSTLSAQSNNDLNQRVSITAKNVTISEILSTLTEKTDIRFAYNPKVIKANKRINVFAQNKTVNTVLKDIFSDEIEIKKRGNYVILASKKEERAKSNERSYYGYVIDSETKDGLNNVSIYSSGGQSVVTDQIGAFRLKLKEDEKDEVQLRKSSYSDHSFRLLNRNKDSEIIIEMSPIKSIDVKVIRDSLVMDKLPSSQKALKSIYHINTELGLNSTNISDTLYYPISFSFYPGISTYRNLSGNIVFNGALNFIGYNKGIHGLEVGLLSNINLQSVKGFQMAGISNHTGDQVLGFQTAGIFNKAGGDVVGLQMAGISNYNFRNLKGSQFAGISNHTLGFVDGLQMSGILNYCRSFSGAQFSGLLNYNNRSRGLQLAGLANISGQINGAQISGLLNRGKVVDGVQLGVVNSTDTIIGFQVSALINQAKVVKGGQLGVINIADTITGIPIGLFNFIRKGYRRIGLSYNDMTPINLSFKSGVESFYTIYSGGINPGWTDVDELYYSFGLGIGSSFNMKNKRFSIESECSVGMLSKKDFVETSTNWAKIHLGTSYQISKNIDLFLGLNLNGIYDNDDRLNISTYESLGEYGLYEYRNLFDSGYQLKAWLGYSFGFNVII